jgi:hypothetical protein
VKRKSDLGRQVFLCEAAKTFWTHAKPPVVVAGGGWESGQHGCTVQICK